MNNILEQISVDIILPNYNSSSYIEETLVSVINQTFKNWKLFIVDDNSDNKTKDILRKYNSNNKIKIIWLKKNKGVAFCRNLALRYSSSNYLAFIDSDDIWYQEKLSDQLIFMIKNNYKFSYTYYEIFRNTLKSIKKVIKPPEKFNFDSFIKNTSIATSTMIIKKDIVGSNKFTKTKICEDYFFKCQMLKKAKNAYCLPKITTKYRIRSNSLQSNKFRNLFWIWSINKKYNNFSFFKNVISLYHISISSIMKYGVLR